MSGTIVDTLKDAKGPLTIREIADAMKIDVEDARRAVREAFNLGEVEQTTIQHVIRYKPSGWDYDKPAPAKEARTNSDPIPKPAPAAKASEATEAKPALPDYIPRSGTMAEKILAVLAHHGQSMTARDIAKVLLEDNPSYRVAPSLSGLLRAGKVTQSGEYGAYRWGLPGWTSEVVAPSEPPAPAVEPPVTPANIQDVPAPTVPTESVPLSEHRIVQAHLERTVQQLAELTKTHEQLTSNHAAAQERLGQLHEKNIALAKELDDQIEFRKADSDTITQLRAENKAILTAIRMSASERYAMRKAISVVNAAL